MTTRTTRRKRPARRGPTRVFIPPEAVVQIAIWPPAPPEPRAPRGRKSKAPEGGYA